jgi:hypothetical protein
MCLFPKGNLFFQMASIAWRTGINSFLSVMFPFLIPFHAEPARYISPPPWGGRDAARNGKTACPAPLGAGPHPPTGGRGEESRLSETDSPLSLGERGHGLSSLYERGGLFSFRYSFFPPLWGHSMSDEMEDSIFPTGKGAPYGGRNKETKQSFKNGSLRPPVGGSLRDYSVHEWTIFALENNRSLLLFQSIIQERCI